MISYVKPSLRTLRSCTIGARHWALLASTIGWQALSMAVASALPVSAPMIKKVRVPFFMGLSCAYSGCEGP
jgi:hypothetical protein